MSWTTTTPQQYQLWAQRPPPVGWAGPWPPPPGSGPWPPGFPGPPPNTMGVSQQAWSDGQWVLNPNVPNYAAGAAAAQGQWAPWPGWAAAAQQHAQQQQQQSYNPYKRVPKPADKSYWETKLQDNGLGLMGMEQKEQQMLDPSHAPPTPWAWAPRVLGEGAAPEQGGGSSKQPPSSHGHSSSSRRSSEQQQQQQSSQSRSGYGDTNGRTSSSSRHDTSSSSRHDPSSSRHDPSRYDAPSSSRHEVPSSSRYDAPSSSRYDTSSSSRHDSSRYDSSRYDSSSRSRRPSVDAPSAPVIPSRPPSRQATSSRDPSASRSSSERHRESESSSRRPSTSRHGSRDQPSPGQGIGSSNTTVALIPTPGYGSASTTPATTPSHRRPTNVDYTTPGVSHASAAAPSVPTPSHRRAGNVDYSTPGVSHASAAASAGTSSRRPSRERDAYTSKRDLTPTFSPRVVRTPDHYGSLGHASASAAAAAAGVVPNSNGRKRGDTDATLTPGMYQSASASAGSTPLKSRSHSHDYDTNRTPGRTPTRSYSQPAALASAATNGYSSTKPRGAEDPRPFVPPAMDDDSPTPIAAPLPSRGKTPGLRDPPRPPSPERPPTASTLTVSSGADGLARLNHFGDEGEQLLSPLVGHKSAASGLPSSSSAAKNDMFASASAVLAGAGAVPQANGTRGVSRSQTYPLIPGAPGGFEGMPETITPTISQSSAHSRTSPTAPYPSHRAPYDTRPTYDAGRTSLDSRDPTRPPPVRRESDEYRSRHGYGRDDPNAPVIPSAPVVPGPSIPTSSGKPLSRHATYDGAQYASSKHAGSRGYGADAYESRTRASPTARPGYENAAATNGYDARTGASSRVSPPKQPAYEQDEPFIPPGPAPVIPPSASRSAQPPSRQPTYDTNGYDPRTAASSAPVVPVAPQDVIAAIRSPPPQASYDRYKGNGYSSASASANKYESGRYDGSTGPSPVKPGYDYDARGTSSAAAAVPPRSAPTPTPGASHRSRPSISTSAAALGASRPSYEAPDMSRANGYHSGSSSGATERPPRQPYSQNTSSSSRYTTRGTGGDAIVIPSVPDDYDVPAPAPLPMEPPPRPPTAAAHHTQGLYERRDSGSGGESKTSSSRSHSRHERERRGSDAAHGSSSRGGSAGYADPRGIVRPDSRAATGMASTATGYGYGSASTSRTSPYSRGSSTSNSPLPSPSYASHDTSKATSPASYSGYDARNASRASPSSGSAGVYDPKASTGSAPRVSASGHSPSGYSSRSRGSASSSRTHGSGSGSSNPIAAPPPPAAPQSQQQPVVPRPTNTVSASASVPPVHSHTAVAPAAQSQPHSHAHSNSQGSTKRRGFWNRRGDHLTNEMQVVYAPTHLANPPDLQNYPSPTEGYLDHHGVYVKYDPHRPEMLDSLPRHGQAPVKPYDSVRTLWRRVTSAGR